MTSLPTQEANEGRTGPKSIFAGIDSDVTSVALT